MSSRWTVGALATDCKVQPTQLVRVLRALAAFNVFSVSSEGTVAHTPRSRLLRTDAPGSLHHAARFWTGPGSWKAWGELDAALAGGVGSARSVEASKKRESEGVHARPAI
jgi:hypothetical protein